MKKKMTRNLIPIFLAASAIFIISTVSAELLASIDCGSSDTTYTDPDNSIIWLSDDDYISTGDSEVVQNSNSLSHVMDTLRVFTSRNKNCYAIPVDRGTKILARASFYYGNYDQKSMPPTFNLQFDGNEWGTVQTMIDSVASYEVTYVVKGDSTSICLAQTNPGQYPFINALEIRSLDPTMYSDGNVDRNRALFLRRRVAYGTNDTISILHLVISFNRQVASSGTDSIRPKSEMDQAPKSEVDQVPTHRHTLRILKAPKSEMDQALHKMQDMTPHSPSV